VGALRIFEKYQAVMALKSGNTADEEIPRHLDISEKYYLSGLGVSEKAVM